MTTPHLLKVHSPNTTIRLSGRMVKFITRGAHFAPPEKTSEESSAARAKRHFADKVNNAFADLYRDYPILYKTGWRVRFLTLTVKGDSPTHAGIASMFKSFKQRLQRLLSRETTGKLNHWETMRYAAVKERGSEKGRLHIHILIFSPYFDISVWRELWSFGAVNIEEVKEAEKQDMDIPNMYGYMVKYFDKSFGAHFAPDKGKKRFFTSRNVKRDVTLLRNPMIDETTDISLLITGCNDKIKLVGVYDNDKIDIHTVTCAMAYGMDKGEIKTYLNSLQPGCSQTIKHSRSKRQSYWADKTRYYKQDVVSNARQWGRDWLSVERELTVSADNPHNDVQMPLTAHAAPDTQQYQPASHTTPDGSHQAP